MLASVIPDFHPTTGALPLGRFGASVGEIRERLVVHEEFSGSETRPKVFADWLKAKEMLDSLDEVLVESTWVGGSFVTNKTDPDDLDCLFILREPAFDALSNRKRERLLKWNQKDKFRNSTNLRVEPFVFVRRVVAQPWAGAGQVSADCAADFAVRGAWDDWWLRMRHGEDKSAHPTEAEAAPIRGYLEVHWDVD